MNDHKLLAYVPGTELVMREGTHAQCSTALRSILEELRGKGRTVTESAGGNRATIQGGGSAQYRYRISSPAE